MSYYNPPLYAPRYGSLPAVDEPIDYSAQRHHHDRYTHIHPPATDLAASEHQRIIGMLERDNATLRQELKVSREKATDLLKELTTAREESRSTHARVEELHRELQHTRDSASRNESLKVAEVQAEVSLARQELRTRDTQIASLQDQLRAEAERMRGLNEHMESQRREVDELRSKLQAAQSAVESSATQVRWG